MSTSDDTALSPTANALSMISLGAFGIGVVAPAMLYAAVLEWFVLFTAASVVQLHTGGYEADAFHVCAWLGAALTCGALGRGWWLSRPQIPALQGGEHPLALPAATESKPRARFPLARVTAVTAGSGALVTTAEWNGNDLLPDPLSSVLVLTGLYLGSIALPLITARLGYSAMSAAYRATRRSSFAAGSISALALVATVFAAPPLLAGFEANNSAETKTRLDVAFDQIDRSVTDEHGLAEATRIALMTFAELAEPGEFRNRTTAEMRKPLKGSSIGALSTPVVAGALKSGSQKPSNGDPVEDCIEEIAGERRYMRKWIEGRAFALHKNFSSTISVEDARDLVVKTLVEVCISDEREEYRAVQAVYNTALYRNALDRKKKIFVRWEYCQGVQPDQCIFARGDDARIDETDFVNELFCHLSEQERQIVTMYAAEGYKWGEIAIHLSITPTQARNSYYYARKRLKAEFGARCSSILSR